MFFCLDVVERWERRKYFSKPRECCQCHKKDYLNMITELCPICNEIFIDYLYDRYFKNKT